MNDLKNIDKFEMVGELLLDLSSQAGEGSLVVIRSDDERLKGISISEVENIIKVIGEESGSFDGYEKYESGYDNNVAFTKLSLMINTLDLRDYLIDLYGVKETKTIPELQQEYEDSKVLYWVDFDKNGQISLNGKYKLGKLQYGSNSYEVFSYFFEQSGKQITKKQIEKARKITITRSMANTFDELGFRGELKKLFFKSSKEKALFRKQVTGKDLKQLKIDTKKLESEIKALNFL